MAAIGGYELEGELGAGGMGRVFRARHGATGAVRALKVLPDTDPELVVRFRREAEALARGGGDGVVPIHETGVHEGRLYYVMDLMPGGSLRDRLKARGALPWREAAAIVAGLGRTLGRYHRAGIVHRDLKPANVLFDKEGTARLADFGCVRDARAAALTATGTFVGTAGYAAPEQLEGAHSAPAADVFALGVLLHELVSGERPFSGTSLYAQLRAIQTGERRPLDAARAPGPLEALVARALALEPARRFADGEALAVALDALLAAEGPAAVARTVPGPGGETGAKTGAKTGPKTGGQARAPRRGALALGGAVVLLAALALVLVLEVRGRQHPVLPAPGSPPGADADRRSPRAKARDEVARSIETLLAESRYDDALAIARRSAGPVSTPWARAFEAEVLLAAGDVDGGERLATETLERPDATEDKETKAARECWLRVVRSEAAARRAQFEAASRDAKVALAGHDCGRARIAAANADLATFFLRGADAASAPGAAPDLVLVSAAVEHLERALALGAEPSQVALPLENAYGARARLRGQKGQPADDDQAQEARWRRVRERSPMSRELEALAELTRSAAGLPEVVFPLASKAIAFSERRGFAYALRGRARLALMRALSDPEDLLGAAIADLDRAATLDRSTPYMKDLVPTLVGALCRRVTRRSDDPAAAADAERAIELAPLSADGYIALSNTLHDRDDADGAIAAIRRGLKFFDRHQMSDLEAARLFSRESVELHRARDHPAARLAADRSVALAPNEPSFLVNRAYLAVVRNDPDAARVDLDRALELAPNYPGAFHLRGVVRQRGDIPGAIQDLERFLELAPDSFEAADDRKLLEELRRR